MSAIVLENPTTLSVSISDDDLCSRCAKCWYRPGENSDCESAQLTGEWPGETDINGYYERCEDFSPVIYTTITGNTPFASIEVRQVINDGQGYVRSFPLSMTHEGVTMAYGVYGVGFDGLLYSIEDHAFEKDAAQRKNEIILGATKAMKVVPFAEERTRG